MQLYEVWNAARTGGSRDKDWLWLLRLHLRTDRSADTTHDPVLRLQCKMNSVRIRKKRSNSYHILNLCNCIAVSLVASMSFAIASIFAPAHLFVYSTLLGTELYQSFVMTKIAYQALPKSGFTTLQKRVFPVYFQGQSLLILLMAATTPPYGPASFIEQRRVWIPIAVAGMAACLNLLSYGPRTQRLMMERVHQGRLLIMRAVLD